MGEKPMGVPATEEDPTAAGSGINTTRSTIKSSGGSAAGVVDEDDQPAGASISTTRSNIKGSGAAAAPGDPVPDIDVKIGK